jgi:hypothetical protein
MAMKKPSGIRSSRRFSGSTSARSETWVACRRSFATTISKRRWCACLFDPDSHEVYLAFAQHWGFTPLPTPLRTPQENGKQERQRRLRQRQRAQGPSVRQPRCAQRVSAAVESHDRAPADSRHDPPPGLDAFRRGRAVSAAATRSRGVSILHRWRADRPHRWPRRSGWRVLSGATRLARAARPRAVGCAAVRVFRADTLVIVHARVAAGLFAPRAGEAEASTRQQAFVDRLVGQCERVGPRSNSGRTQRSPRAACAPFA